LGVARFCGGGMLMCVWVASKGKEAIFPGGNSR
jgi:hypothetical protein